MIRGLITAAGLLALWEAATWLFGLPFYILPPPSSVALALWMRADLLAEHALITATEIVVGLLVGVALGVGTALLVVRSALARRWLLPVVIASQAIPVFALAPLLVLWFGYGLASKIVMAALVIYFPVATSFFDGLRTTPTGWMELARTMGASEGAILRQMRVPAALPALAQGLRIAAAVAPSAPSSANGSAAAPASASSCCMPTAACRSTCCSPPWWSWPPWRSRSITGWMRCCAGSFRGNPKPWEGPDETDPPARGRHPARPRRTGGPGADQTPAPP